MSGGSPRRGMFVVWVECPAAQGMDTTVGDRVASESGGSGITGRQAGAPEPEQKSGGPVGSRPSPGAGISKRMRPKKIKLE